MELAGICSACGQAALVRSCELCGAPVCAVHYDAFTGLCKACVRGRIAGAGRKA